MSSILFHTEHDDEAALWGGERAHMGLLIDHLATALIPEHSDERVMETLIPERRETYRMTHLRSGSPVPADWGYKVDIDRLRTSVHVGFDGDIFQHEGKPLQTFSLKLNTILAFQSEPMALLAKLHAQCEIHTYVEGPNRAWMADVIERGMKTGLFRDLETMFEREAGGDSHEWRTWQNVVALLRKRDDEPVVTSYTVCEGFPGSHLMKDSSWSPEPLPEKGTDEYWEARDEAWYALSDAQQWELCMAALRSDDGGLEIKPGMEDKRYRHKKSFFDLFG